MKKMTVKAVTIKKTMMRMSRNKMMMMTATAVLNPRAPHEPGVGKDPD